MLPSHLFICGLFMLGALTAAAPEVIAADAGASAAMNAMCPVMPEEPAVEQFWIEYEGRRVYFCCARCRSRFQRDPERYMAVLLAATADASSAPDHDQAHDHDDDLEHAYPGTDTIVHDEHDHHHGQTPWFLAWLGRFHPAAAHFPVALLITAAIAELLRRLRQDDGLDAVVRFCAWAGAIGAAVAAPLGWFNAGWDLARDDWVLGVHRWAGTATLLWSVPLVVLIEVSRRRGTAGWRRCRFAALMIGAVLVGLVGHFGGVLVYGTNYYLW
jgi:YHS domain-containing protein/uncharacterized membrane protein